MTQEMRSQIVKSDSKKDIQDDADAITANSEAGREQLPQNAYPGIRSSGTNQRTFRSCVSSNSPSSSSGGRTGDSFQIPVNIAQVDRAMSTRETSLLKSARTKKTAKQMMKRNRGKLKIEPDAEVNTVRVSYEKRTPTLLGERSK
jgi:hypothetical protein